MTRAAAPPTAKRLGRRTTPPSMLVERVAITALKFDSDNARVHNPRNLQAMRDSLAKFGQRRAVVAQHDGTVLAGNGLLQAAADLGWTHVDVHYSELEGEAARAFAIADNRVGELSYFDDLVLAEQLTQLPDDLVAVLGFDSGDMARLAELVDATTTAPGERAVDGRDLLKTKHMRGKAFLRITIMLNNAEVIERALNAAGLENREEALVRVCQHFLDTKGREP